MPAAVDMAVELERQVAALSKRPSAGPKRAMLTLTSASPPTFDL